MYDNVIVMLILWRHQNATVEKRKCSRILAECLKNESTNFHQIYVIFRQSDTEAFKIKRMEIIIHCCHGSQFMREFWAKNHDFKIIMKLNFYNSELILRFWVNPIRYGLF